MQSYCRKTKPYLKFTLRSVLCWLNPAVQFHLNTKHQKPTIFFQRKKKSNPLDVFVSYVSNTVVKIGLLVSSTDSHLYYSGSMFVIL